MEGLTVIETPMIMALITELQATNRRVEELHAALGQSNTKWLTAQQVMAETGFSKNWLSSNKQLIGFSTVGGCLRFKRTDVDEFIEANYIKVNRTRRKNL